MTTTVTVTAHSWPVEVVTTDSYDHEHGHTYKAETTVTPPNSSRSLYLTSTRSLSFNELPIPHTTSVPAEGDAEQ